jgi:hypothetical protein
MDCAGQVNCDPATKAARPSSSRIAHSMGMTTPAHCATETGWDSSVG